MCATRPVTDPSGLWNCPLEFDNANCDFNGIDGNSGNSTSGGGGSLFDPNQPGSCLYLNNEGTGITPGQTDGGGIDPNSTAGECLKEGGIFSPSPITAFSLSSDGDSVELFSNAGISIGYPGTPDVFFSKAQVLSDAQSFQEAYGSFGPFGLKTFNTATYAGCVGDYLQSHVYTRVFEPVTTLKVTLQSVLSPFAAYQQCAGLP
jgi:hypothetical protein